MIVCSVYCGLLIYRYSLNESSTQISINKRSHIANPDITICLDAQDGGIFTRLDESANASSVKCTQGKVNSVQCSMYKMLNGVENKTNDSFPKQGFHEAILPSYQYLHYLNLRYFGSTKAEKTTGHEIPVQDSYLDPNDQCFTFKSGSNKSEGLDLAIFGFDIPNLQKIQKRVLNVKKEPSLMVLLHHSGQLIRGSGQIRYYAYMGTLTQIIEDIDKTNMVEIKIQALKLIRDRPDGKRKCSMHTNKNQDSRWMQAVTDITGCVPSYWTTLVSYDYLPNCSLSKDLKKASEYHMRPTKGHGGSRALSMNKNEDEIFNAHRPPCHEMHISSTHVQYKSSAKKGEFQIKISFMSDQYEDINNVRGYELTSLLAEIGGYIGVFLGFSILQGFDNFIALLKWYKGRYK